jgi:hypothetical protein
MVLPGGAAHRRDRQRQPLGVVGQRRPAPPRTGRRAAFLRVGQLDGDADRARARLGRRRDARDAAGHRLRPRLPPAPAPACPAPGVPPRACPRLPASSSRPGRRWSAPAARPPASRPAPRGAWRRCRQSAPASVPSRRPDARGVGAAIAACSAARAVSTAARDCPARSGEMNCCAARRSFERGCARPAPAWRGPTLDAGAAFGHAAGLLGQVDAAQRLPGGHAAAFGHRSAPAACRRPWPARWRSAAPPAGPRIPAAPAGGRSCGCTTSRGVNSSGRLFLPSLASAPDLASTPRHAGQLAAQGRTPHRHHQHQRGAAHPPDLLHALDPRRARCGTSEVGRSVGTRRRRLTGVRRIAAAGRRTAGRPDGPAEQSQGPA